MLCNIQSSYVLYIIILIDVYVCVCGSVNKYFDSIAEAFAPMVQGLVTISTSQCDSFKNLFGLTFHQIQEKKIIPDLEAYLTIDHITKTGTYKINITTASRNILDSQKFDMSLKTVVIIPGYMETSQGVMVMGISREFLQLGGWNVFAVDSEVLVKNLYVLTSTNILFIGVKLGEILYGLYKGGVSRTGIMLVGHSLGAHIAGMAGKQFHTLSATRIGRITGLDPAGPCFTTADKQTRLQSNDAEYVDVIHTDVGVLGINENLGDNDFYPNSGTAQPGCGFNIGCSHTRAWVYYQHSIRNADVFIGKKCNSWQHFKSGTCDSKIINRMGLHSISSRHNGVFYLITNDSEPYGLGNKGIIVN